jgi:DNA-binding winged helix-turn-helix (wHTH) protein
MGTSMQAGGESAFVFGPFEFHPTRQLLARAGVPLRIGSRGREVLRALLEGAGTTVQKRALVARVWPDTVVEEGTLRVHIAGLRKLLSDGQNGRPYIENIHGVGYRFCGPVTRPHRLPYATNSHRGSTLR